MQKLRSRACIGGRTFVLETIVEHATSGEHLVLCRDDSGKLVYVSPEEWEAPRADELGHRGLVASIDADILTPGWHGEQERRERWRCFTQSFPTV